MKYILVIFFATISNKVFPQMTDLDDKIYVNVNYIKSISCEKFMGSRDVQENEITYIKKSNSDLSIGIGNSFTYIKSTLSNGKNLVYNIDFLPLDKRYVAYLTGGSMTGNIRECEIQLFFKGDTAFISVRNKSNQVHVNKFIEIKIKPIHLNGKYVHLYNYLLSGKYLYLEKGDTITIREKQIKGFKYDSYNIELKEFPDSVTSSRIVHVNYICSFAKSDGTIISYIMEPVGIQRFFYIYDETSLNKNVNKKLAFTLNCLEK